MPGTWTVCQENLLAVKNQGKREFKWAVTGKAKEAGLFKFSVNNISKSSVLDDLPA